MPRAAPLTVADYWAQREVERHLLGWALLAVGLATLMLLGARPMDGLEVKVSDLGPVAWYALAFLGAHGVLVLARFRGDQLVLPVVALLCGLGVLARMRMGLFDAPRGGPLDSLLLPGGVGLMLLVVLAGMGGRYRHLGTWPWLFAVLSLAIPAALLLTGERFRGGVYGLGFITPGEVLKLSVVLFAAGYIDRQARALGTWNHVLPPWKPLWPLLAFSVALIGLLMLQRDLGMLVILSLALLAQLGYGSRHWGWLVYGLAAAAAAGYGLVSLFSHGARRVEVWLDPFQDPTGTGWQVLQGLSGMYAGGLWGEGFSQGRPRYAPIAESDFIYAVLAEEFGFIGGVLLLVFFAVLLARLFLLAARARTGFGMLLATGIATVLAAQTLLNLGGVTKALPLTGLTLPLISHGGSSLLTVFVSLGLVLAISDGEPAGTQPRRKAPKSPPKPRAGRTRRAKGDGEGTQAATRPD